VGQTVSGRVMPIIAVGSVDDVRNFYVDRLGFEHVMGMVGKDGQLDFCTVVLGQARVMFTRVPGGARPPAGKQPVEIYLEVDDVDALHNQLKKKEVAIGDPLTVVAARAAATRLGLSEVHSRADRSCASRVFSNVFGGGSQHVPMASAIKAAESRAPAQIPELSRRSCDAQRRGDGRALERLECAFSSITCR